MIGEHFNLMAAAVEALSVAGKRADFEAHRAAARFDELDRQMVDATFTGGPDELMRRQRAILAEYRAANAAHALALDDLSALLKGEA